MLHTAPPESDSIRGADAVGFDRVMRITFAEPVRAEDVLASIQESLDTQD